MALPTINLNGMISSRSSNYSQLNSNNVEDTNKVSVFDRGFLFGDSLYEVIRTYRQRPFHLKDHLDRLFISARLCRMTLSQTKDHYEKEVEKTLTAFFDQDGTKNRSDPDSSQEAYIRVIVTRGVGNIGFGLSLVASPTQYVIIVQPLEALNKEKFDRGMHLKIVSRLRCDPRSLDPAMKSGNYLNSLLAYLEATEAGAEDALMCNSEGFLTEGSTFNLFYVKRGIIVTSPLDIGILDGITRKIVLEIAKSLGLRAREIRFPKERLFEADEVFISSSIREVFPVAQVDGIRFENTKRPGPITLKIKEAFDGWEK